MISTAENSSELIPLNLLISNIAAGENIYFSKWQKKENATTDPAFQEVV